MALIDHINPVTRRIYLSAGTMNTAWHPVDLYREVRALRRTNVSLRAYDNFMRSAGNINKGGGKATERYFTLLLGTRIIPWDASHTLDITGTIITDDGFEGVHVFDKSTLTAGIAVDIQYAPKQVEVINLNFSDLVYSSFQGAVWVDVANGASNIGTDNFPNGTTERPVNSVQLATNIAATRGFRTIQIIGNYTLGAGDDISKYRIVGTSHINSVLTIEPAAQTYQSRYNLLKVTGTLDGGSEIIDCQILDINFFNGDIMSCALFGKITLGGGFDAEITNSVQDDYNSIPIIDLGGSGQNLIMTKWSGEIILQNCSDVTSHHQITGVGEVIIEPSVTAGTIEVFGDIKITDLTTTGNVVIQDNTSTNLLVSALGNINNSLTTAQDAKLMAIPTPTENADAVWSKVI